MTSRALATQKVEPKKRKPNADAVVYRYVEADSERFWPGELSVRDRMLAGLGAPMELELEIELSVFGYFEPGYGFFLQSAECDGREFLLTADERANIELDRTIAHSDDMEDRRSDAIAAAADARRDR